MKKLLVTTAAAVFFAACGATPAWAQSYSNCSEARAAGAAPVHRGEPGYSSALDRDGDGVGCEGGASSSSRTRSAATSTPVRSATATRAAATTTATRAAAAVETGTPIDTVTETSTAAATSTTTDTVTDPATSSAAETTTLSPEPTTPVTDSVTTDPTASPTDTTAPTTDPTADPTAAPTTVPITDIDVDVDIDDHSDHSINFTYTANSTFVVEGDRYSSVYVYRDEDGRTYRGHDLDCSDFGTQAAAQRVLDSASSDIYWLDADNDGVACEVDNGEFTQDAASKVGVRRGGQISVLPYGSVATGGGA